MARFPNTQNFDFDAEKEYQKLYLKGLKTLAVLDLAVDMHYERIKENCTNYLDAVELINIIQDEIQYILNVYISCLSKATKNYFNFLLEEYNQKLHKKLKDSLPFSE
jgi:predicted component of type VI protein secretion system